MGIIRRLATQNGYDLVVDKQAVPYHRSDLDLTDRVIVEYNQAGGAALAGSAAPAPAAPAAPPAKKRRRRRWRWAPGDPQNRGAWLGRGGHRSGPRDASVGSQGSGRRSLPPPLCAGARERAAAWATLGSFASALGRREARAPESG
jgi:hypothetical protein